LKFKSFPSILVFTIACTAISIVGVCGSAADAEDAYRRAVMNYQAHHYSAALTDLEKLVNQYPNNAMVRYYRALAYQGTNQMSLARKDFEWVATNCPDGRVKQLGAAGLRNLGSSGSGGTGTSSSALANNGVQKFFAQQSPSGGSATASSSGSSAGVSTQNIATRSGGKLQKILEFTSDTCPTCITFAPIFAQTKSRYPGLDMQSLDVADSGNASLVSQYQVTNYPTIVFLSNSGSVLFRRAGAPVSVAQFSQLIDQYR
jgi:thiol-disulfide isomerase/thioredoxin